VGVSEPVSATNVRLEACTSTLLAVHHFEGCRLSYHRRFCQRARDRGDCPPADFPGEFHIRSGRLSTVCQNRNRAPSRHRFRTEVVLWPEPAPHRDIGPHDGDGNAPRRRISSLGNRRNNRCGRTISTGVVRKFRLHGGAARTRFVRVGASSQRIESPPHCRSRRSDPRVACSRCLVHIAMERREELVPTRSRNLDLREQQVGTMVRTCGSVATSLAWDALEHLGVLRNRVGRHATSAATRPAASNEARPVPDLWLRHCWASCGTMPGMWLNSHARHWGPASDGAPKQSRTRWGIQLGTIVCRRRRPRILRS
jgi:hypothetical protein